MFNRKPKPLPPEPPKKLLAVSESGDDVIIEFRCNRKMWGCLAGWLGKGLGQFVSFGLAGVTSGLLVINFYPHNTETNPPIEPAEKIEQIDQARK